MKILYLVPDPTFFSEGYRGRVMHALGICEGFSEIGCEVTILGGAGLLDLAGDLPGDVNVRQLNNEAKSKFSIKWRILFFEAADKLIQEETPDVVIARYVISSAFALYFRGVGESAIRVLEVNSFAYHIAKCPGVLRAWVARLEKILVNRFHILYVISETMRQDPLLADVKSEVVAIVNGATSRKVAFERSASCSPSSLRLVYFGSLMSYWDFEWFVNAINSLHREVQIPVLFLGDGPERQFLEDSLESADLIEFGGKFDRSDLGRFLDKRTDILVLPPKKAQDLALTGGMSTKIFDYMSLGMPILACGQPEMTRLFSEGEEMVFYPPGDDAAFLRQISELISKESLRDKIASKAAARFFKEFSWSSRMKILETAIRAVS